MLDSQVLHRELIPYLIKKICKENKKFLAVLKAQMNSTLYAQEVLDLSEVKIKTMQRHQNRKRINLQFLIYSLYKKPEDEAEEFFLEILLQRSLKIIEFHYQIEFQNRNEIKLFLTELICSWFSNANEFFSYFNGSYYRNRKNKTEVVPIFNLVRICIVHKSQLPKPKQSRRIGVGHREPKSSAGNLSPSRFLDQTQEQNLIEEKRKTKEDTSNFIRGMFL